MKIDDKFINFKFCPNGKFQITGAKNEEQIIKLISYMWKYISDIDDTCIFLKNNDKIPTALIYNVMFNMDFQLGFSIDREVLNKYIIQETNYLSYYEPSNKYSGVVIKVYVDRPSKIFITKMVLNNMNKWDCEQVEFDEYLSFLDIKDAKKEIKRNKKHTFMVFAKKGSVIHSGPYECQMSEERKKFIKMLNMNKDFFKE